MQNSCRSYREESNITCGDKEAGSIAELGFRRLKGDVGSLIESKGKSKIIVLDESYLYNLTELGTGRETLIVRF